MMSGGDADLKPLVMSCLDDALKLRPSVSDISERLKKMKDVCCKKTDHNGMDPISWLAITLQVCCCSSEWTRK